MSFMDRLTNVVENRIAPPLIKISKNRYLDSIQKAFISLMPIIIIASFFVLLASFPIPAWQKLIEPISSYFWAGNSATMGLLSIGLSLGMGYYLSAYYKQIDDKVDPLSGAIISLFSFLMLFPIGTNDKIGSYLPADNLGSTGMFAAIIVGIISIEIYRLLVKKNIVMKMPEGVPPMVANAFTSLIPIFVTIALWWIIRYPLNLDLVGLIMAGFKPIVAGGASFIAQFIGVFLDRLLWFVGIHGTNVVTSVMQPIWLDMLGQNQAAAGAGNSIPFIASEQFLNYFVRVSPLPLIILMLMSSVKRYKTLGKLAVAPSLFNIAEPVIFGLPIILNPILFIPWVFGYLVIFVISYLVIASGLVPAPYILLPWTTPGPIGAYLGTGGSWAAAILSTLNYVIMFFIWLPFYRILERQTLKEQNETENNA
ncbi:PTS transporter subunit EIIC [Virgibacillus sp. 179-BFC.A HS]|uniref:Permease IIC component n=1 Tax=Tigheibacillus jepli TaxID=3035914 RepID=A0ABU5CJF7_9BACI|nr:PTS transporter subunit EIIC [Virgibacillus sp. 179-BFC.A HS]MDY0406489.1 PTS transporter subunit EIIC [Virgibacillus sp. 179-BFC.A HS]